MTSPRSKSLPSDRDRTSGQGPTAEMQFPEMTTAPFSTGGCATGTRVRARIIMSVEPLIVKSLQRLIRFNDRRINAQPSRRFRFLAGPFRARGDLVLAGLPFVVALADLLFDFFGDLVNGGVQVAFDVLGKKVGPAHAYPDGAGELFSGGAGMVMFEGHARINGA